jgi:hypothetical protein
LPIVFKAEGLALFFLMIVDIASVVNAIICPGAKLLSRREAFEARGESE